MMGDSAKDAPWKFVKSVLVPPNRVWEENDPIKHKFASSLGIIPESARHRDRDEIESGLFRGWKDTADAATARAFQHRYERGKVQHQRTDTMSPPTIPEEEALPAHLPVGSPSRLDVFQPSMLEAALEEVLRDKPASPSANDAYVSGRTLKLKATRTRPEATLETRRRKRSELMRSAIPNSLPSVQRVPLLDAHAAREQQHITAMFDNLDIFTLRPRHSIRLVEGTLYDEDGPFREGATSDSLSVRLFFAPGDDPANSNDGVSFLITTPDNRVFSAAKRRRWAMDHHGNFFAAMEIKSVESKLRAAKSEMVDPYFAKEYENDLRKYYIEDILDEMQKAETLTPGERRIVPHVLQTEDGKVLRLEEDFPEEAFFVIAGCQDHEIYPVIARVFVEAIRLLWRMHCHGWMHGDIKLENLMFNEQSKLYLIDFENASPFRGSPEHDGKIQLLSFDWTPPELEVSHLGRRMNPTGDLYALGCNIVRGFALRDGITDKAVREMFMGNGLPAFVSFRESLLNSTAKTPTMPPIHYGINLVPLLENADKDVSPVYMNPARVLRLFAKRAPKLLQYVLAHCVAPSVYDRNERLGVALAEEMANDPANAELWAIVDKALATSIELSGSSWVKPKLDEARHILELTS